MASIRLFSDFRMTAIAFAAGLLTLLVALLAIDSQQMHAHTMPLLLLFALFVFAGLVSDFYRLKRNQADLARQQRELILQATLFTMSDTTNSLRHDLQLLYEKAEGGDLPDLEALQHLQHLLDEHVSRLQHLGEVGTFSHSWATKGKGQPAPHQWNQLRQQAVTHDNSVA